MPKAYPKKCPVEAGSPSQQNAQIQEALETFRLVFTDAVLSDEQLHHLLETIRAIAANIVDELFNQSAKKGT